MIIRFYRAFNRQNSGRKEGLFGGMGQAGGFIIRLQKFIHRKIAIMNVLIFPAGTEIGREIWLSLRHVKDVTLFLGGADYDNHARYYGEAYHILPAVNQPGWQNSLNQFIETCRIDFIFPAHDEALVALAQQQDLLGARVVAPGKECCEITRSKTATYHALRDIIPVPQLFEHAGRVERWPVFVKPDRGQGAQGAERVDTAAALEQALLRTPSAIICEYLPGREFTIDCFSSRKQGLLFCQARSRERVRAGISMGSETLSLPGIETLAAKIATRLGIFGAWFFQVKFAENGSLTLLEVAPRIAGTMATNRIRGVNFALLSLYEHNNISLALLPVAGNVRVSRALVNRYRFTLEYRHAYVDFDDTLLLKGKLCLPLMTFLFQCLNEGVGCTLITRHRGDIHQQLRRWRLESLFDEVIHLRAGEKKSDFIHRADAIFIDDSFAERREVSRAKNIPTFDLSMLEALLKE